MAINNFTAVGRLGQDAELRYTPSGKAVASFSVAVDVGFGENKSTLWVRCNLWGKQGEAVAQYLLKGDPVGISGELSNREWQDKEGQTKTSLEVNVRDVALLGPKREGQSKPSQHQQEKQDGYEPAQTNSPKPSFDDLGDDIPF